MSDQPTPGPNFLHIPYEQRWEYLKPAIVQIYMEERESLIVLSQRMKDELSFAAS